MDPKGRRLLQRMRQAPEGSSLIKVGSDQIGPERFRDEIVRKRDVVVSCNRRKLLCCCAAASHKVQ